MSLINSPRLFTAAYVTVRRTGGSRASSTVSRLFSGSFNKVSGLSKQSLLRGASTSMDLSVGTDSTGCKEDKQDMLLLEELNGHPLDHKVGFNAETHTYTFGDQIMSNSVTQLINSYFGTFDTLGIVSKMMSGSKWPRPEYTFSDGTPYSAAEVMESWKLNSEDARNRGTIMHSNIERILNDLDPLDMSPELDQFSEFYEDIILGQDMSPHRTEWRVAAPELSLAGCVDFVGKHRDGSYVIMDWKRSKNLSKAPGYAYGKKAKRPVQHLHDVEKTKHFLQLNMYKYILEKHYDIKVSEMILASFHPDKDEYFAANVPLYEKEIESIVEDVLHKLMEQKLFGDGGGVGERDPTANIALGVTSSRNEL